MIFELCWFSAKDVNANWLCGVHYRIKFHKSSRNPCIHSSKVSKVNFILVWNKKTCWCVRFSETLQFRTFFFIVQFICCCQILYCGHAATNWNLISIWIFDKLQTTVQWMMPNDCKPWTFVVVWRFSIWANWSAIGAVCRHLNCGFLKCTLASNTFSQYIELESNIDTW